MSDRPAIQEALVLFASLAKWGRTWYDAYDLDKLTPEVRAELTAWAEAGCPDPAPAVYDEDLPF